MKKFKKIALLVALVAAVYAGLQAWDDEKLFTTTTGGAGKSNVIFVQDTSGSMREVVYHPDFNPNISLSLSGGSLPTSLDRTRWFMRWYYLAGTTRTLSAETTYARIYSVSLPDLVVYAEGNNIKEGDWILQYDPNDTESITHQAFGQVTEVSAPDANKRFTLTLDADTIQGTFNTSYRLYIFGQNATISSWDSGTKVLRVNGDLRSYFSVNDYIMLYDNDDNHNTNRQVIAQISGISYSSSLTRFVLTNIIGTINTSYQDRVYYRRPAETRLVCLYGSNLDMDGDYVYYQMNVNYLRWVFAYANNAQRKQVSDLHTLGHHVDFNGYIRATPVSPLNAYSLNPDNSNNTDKTLLEEWNDVMRAIYPVKVASLKTAVNASTASIIYEKHKSSLAGYAPGFKIKIDAETMLVNDNVVDGDGKWGTLTVTRGVDNTTASAHVISSAIMIYNNDNEAAGPLINEYTPVTHLFSSMQHVTESTGDLDATWTESITDDFDDNGSNETKSCYRYKRVFTRIQTAREALCDVVTAKNKLFSVADLAAAVATDTETTLVYCNVNPDFLLRAAPFYIKVSDPNDASTDEVMLVTAHDPDTMSMTVSRGQQGTDACSHAAYSKVLAYSGARDLVRFGLFYFPVTDLQDSSYLNARLRVPLNDFGKKNADGTYISDSYINTTILDRVHDLSPDGGTPLAKALAMVWNYLKPNNNDYDADNLYNCYIRANSSGWNAVDSTTFGTAEKFETIDGVTHPKGSPMEYWCQENYVVLITDGRSENDADITNSRYGVFSRPWQRTETAANIVSDFFKFDYNRSTNPTPWGDGDTRDTNHGTDGLYCLAGTCWANSGTDFLDDVAFFLSHQDMFPTSKIKTGGWDTTNKIFIGTNAEADATLYSEFDSDPRKKWPGNQNIITNTVGLCIQNDMLIETAKNGFGKNFTAFNYRDLADAFQTIVTSISLLDEPMTYTTYAAPKQSITGGKYGYVAHFNPKERAVWEGHIRRFLLDDDGDFPAEIDDPNAQVVVNGIPYTSFQWDAVARLTERDAAGTPRVVYTAKKEGGDWVRKNFMADIDASDLDVTEAQVTQVKKFTQNLVNADDSAISAYVGFKLGETFHFNPQLVGYPLKWRASFDGDYESFYKHFSDDNDEETPANPTARKEVLYAGANDGKVHCFNAANGDELWSFVPNSQLKKLKIPALNPLMTSSHTYFCDGKAVVRDIRVSSTFTGTEAWQNWRTGLFFGMGIGGRSYCALDVTYPDNPLVLWEFDDGYDASTNPEGRMGFTESKPIVVDMHGGSYGKFPGVLLAGGYNEPEIALDTSLPYLDWQKREGKALYVLDARDGTLIKKFIPGTGTDSATLGYLDGLKYAVTCAPVAFDKNNDGLADTIYFAESGDPVVANGQGGRIWKMNCFGNPLNWTASVIYQAPAGQTIFIPPSIGYADPQNYQRLWVMFGTGRRPQAAYGSGSVFTNLTGQFVAFIDDGTITTPLTNDDLDNVTIDVQTAPAPDTYDIRDEEGNTVSRGFYFNFFSDTNEIMFEPSPLYVGYKVYFMTFSPHEGEGSTGSSDDPCGGSSSVGGKHYIYTFTLTSQGNTFTIGDFMAQAGKILGYGPMDDKWKPYLGDGAAGNFKPNPTPPVELDNIFGPMLWKEDKK